MAITKEILDELLKDYQKPEDLLGQSGLLQQLSKALIERVLDGEMTHHLGYEKHSPEGRNSGNSRNGKSRKTLKGKQGEIPIEVVLRQNLIVHSKKSILRMKTAFIDCAEAKFLFVVAICIVLS